MAVQAAAQAVMAFSWDALLLGIILIVLAVILLHFLKNVLVNTVLGVVVLVLLNLIGDYTHYAVLKIPITFVTVIISAVLGLAGVGLLILLKLLGIVIA